MPTHAIREVLTGNLEFDAEGLQGSKGMLQKRINLEDGYRYTVVNVQVFNDRARTPPSSSTGPSGESIFAEQVFVTPYPITLTNNEYGTFTIADSTLTNSGPYMADESVIYKSITFSMDSVAAGLNSGEVFFQEFPNPALEQPTADQFYTPHIYLTCIQQSFAAENRPITLSFYLEVEKTKCSALEASMGQYKELLEAQCRLLTDTANIIDPTSSAAGRSFPTWKFGGMRPEIMATSANVLKYYNKLADRAYQEMDPITGFVTRFKESTTMVAFDQPFGDTATGIPDWIQLMDVSGVTSGIIRPYPPPVKFTGSGNTVMYDAAGNPASVIT